MDENQRKICNDLRSKSLEDAASWILENYTVSGKDWGEALILIPHRSWKKADQVRFANYYLSKIPYANDRGIPSLFFNNESFIILDRNMVISAGHVSVGTMHHAKGLEFRAVVVMACDDEIIPSQQHIEKVSDDSDLEEVYNSERHLLYVACTRARDHLLITSVDPASEFLNDLLSV